MHPSAQSHARVIVLVGPKGSGKTTLGRMLEAALPAHFLEVERLAQEVLAEHGGVIDDRYAERVFAAIEQAVHTSCAQHPTTLFETTGAAPQSVALLNALRERYRVTLVRVRASLETCERRIRDRDPSRQVAVPPELARAMHERTQALELPWDLELDNEHGLSAAELAQLVPRF